MKPVVSPCRALLDTTTWSESGPGTEVVAGAETVVPPAAACVWTVTVQARVVRAGDENRLTGYAGLPLNLNPYLPTYDHLSPAAGAVRPDAASYDIVFDTPSRRVAGKFTFRFWVNDKTPPRLSLLTRSVRAGRRRPPPTRLPRLGLPGGEEHGELGADPPEHASTEHDLRRTLAAVALVDRRQLREVALHARRELVALVELLFVGPQKLQLGLAPVALTASPCFETEVPCETRPLGADDGEDRAREERDRQPAHGINSLPTPFASKEGLPTTRYVDS